MNEFRSIEKIAHALLAAVIVFGIALVFQFGHTTV
jgi:hypothetical protein